MKTFDFTLSGPISYQATGENTQASMLELTAPSVKNRKKVAKLKQGFMRVINDLPETQKKEAQEQAEKEKGKSEAPDPQEILTLIQMGAVEYDEYIDIFVSLLVSGICKIEGEVAMTQLIADKISFQDMEKLMGEYLVNFILVSGEE